MTVAEPSYESVIVRAFIRNHAGYRERDGRLDTINGIRVIDSHRVMLARWAEWETVPVHKLDRFLLRYDLLLVEFELWAEREFGYTGLAEPSPAC